MSPVFLAGCAFLSDGSCTLVHCTRESQQMRAFERYVEELEEFAAAALRGEEHVLARLDLGAVLNGAVSRKLREAVHASTLQEKGAFFTPTELKRVALASLINERLIDRVTWDPACGAGDLLLGCAEHLPLGSSLADTVSLWSQVLFGSDVEPVFLRAARARLVLAAYARGARSNTLAPLPLSELFPGLKLQDALNPEGEYPPTGCVVLNPPFVDVPAPAGCEWSSGGTSAAAVILERCLVSALPNTRVVAILPDVLRSGSRYAAWRRMVEWRAGIRRIDVYGTFDPTTDVDVFVLELTVTADRAPLPPTVQDPRWHGSVSEGMTLGDLCVVSVGAVVPHRHEEIGPDYAYLHSSDAPQWGTVADGFPRRRFSGTVFQPPFVVVRRTSSPRDSERPVGTIVLGRDPIAVENHLLVLRPKRGGVRTCRAILRLLRDPATREWLDRRIRTRHLTVAALRDVPYEELGAAR